MSESVPDPLWESDGYVLKDRTGYTVDPYNFDKPGHSPYFVVHRETDGTGIGAYGNDRDVDVAIATDREWVAANQPPADGTGEQTVTEPAGTAPVAPDTIQVTGRQITYP